MRDAVRASAVALRGNGGARGSSGGGYKRRRAEARGSLADGGDGPVDGVRACVRGCVFVRGGGGVIFADGTRFCQIIFDDLQS